MSAPARALMAGLACFVVWTMIRAWRSGTLFSEDMLRTGARPKH